MDYVSSWFIERASKAEYCAATVHDVHIDGATAVPALAAARMDFGRGATGVLVSYEDESEEQRAFNIAASLLPEGVKLACGAFAGGADWTYLPPTNLSPRGYIGWRLPPDEGDDEVA